MNQGYQIYYQNQLHFLTFQIVKWVDVLRGNNIKTSVSTVSTFAEKRKGWSFMLM